MDGWSGFSDEDLRRLKHSSSDNSRQSKEKPLPNPSRSGPVRATQSRKTNPKAIPAKRLPDDSNQLLSSEQRLSASAVTAAETDDGSQRERTRNSGEKRTTTTNEVTKQRVESTGTGMANLTQDKNQSDKAQPGVSVQEGGSGGDLILDEQFILKHEIADLEKFREHQKMMEEQNKKKKEMLTVAIQQRQKKAKAEATKLTIIKKELDRLDQMVNADVSVIRNKIEEISREFLEAKKRYDRAEKEFVEAKVDLNKKSLQKEQLTEHLYTVIHQNEQRKAKKLSELMNKLEMADIDDDLLLADDCNSPPVPILHISATETRKGCLQSLGLSLISSPPETAASDKHKTGEAANGDTEGKSSVAKSDNAAAHSIEPNSLDASGTKGDSTSGTKADSTSGTKGESTSGTKGDSTSGTKGESTSGTKGESTSGTKGESTSGTKGDGTSNDVPGTANESTVTVCTDTAISLTVDSISNNQTDSLLNMKKSQEVDSSS